MPRRPNSLTVFTHLDHCLSRPSLPSDARNPWVCDRFDTLYMFRTFELPAAKDGCNILNDDDNGGGEFKATMILLRTKVHLATYRWRDFWCGFRVNFSVAGIEYVTTAPWYDSLQLNFSTRSILKNGGYFNVVILHYAEIMLTALSIILTGQIKDICHSSKNYTIRDGSKRRI